VRVAARRLRAQWNVSDGAEFSRFLDCGPQPLRKVMAGFAMAWALVNLTRGDNESPETLQRRAIGRAS